MFICARAWRSSGESNSHSGLGVISRDAFMQVGHNGSPRRASSPVRHAGQARTVGTSHLLPLPDNPPVTKARDGRVAAVALAPLSGTDRIRGLFLPRDRSPEPVNVIGIDCHRPPLGRMSGPEARPRRPAAPAAG